MKKNNANNFHLYFFPSLNGQLGSVKQTSALLFSDGGVREKQSL